MNDRRLRRGDLVEVKAASEILATLDDRGALDDLPFMPEMVAFCGRRLRVEKRADKICDTIRYTGSRRLPDSVILEDHRCDGSAHDGCQAECRFFWKEAWLRPAGPGEPPSPAGPADPSVAALLERTRRNTRRAVETPEGPAERHLCQATELFHATVPLSFWDAASYVRELTWGNVSALRFALVMARALVQEARRKAGLLPEVHVRGPETPNPRLPVLNLEPGEWVQVKSRREIAATLTPKGRNRGLWFDREMLPYCGGTFRVRQQVRRFVDEATGKMVELKNDCVTLEGVTCSGERSVCRWFCPRAIYPYWRESWLRRVEPRREPAPAAPRAANAGPAEDGERSAG